jgi:hypothetical protein
LVVCVSGIVSGKYRGAFEVVIERRMARPCGCVSSEEGIGCRRRVTFGGGCGGIFWEIVSDA